MKLYFTTLEAPKNTYQLNTMKFLLNMVMCLDV